MRYQFFGRNYQARLPEAVHLSDTMRKRFETVPAEARADDMPRTGRAAALPARSVGRDAGQHPREFDAVRRLYGLIDQHCRRVLELQACATMLKAEIHTPKKDRENEKVSCHCRIRSSAVWLREYGEYRNFARWPEHIHSYRTPRTSTWWKL
jgi:hypothetical protein